MPINTLQPDPGMMGSVTPTIPSYLQQQPVSSPTQGVADMVRALVQGRQQFADRQRYQQSLNASGVPTGQPMNLVPQSVSALNIPAAPSSSPTWQQNWNPGSSGGGLW